HRLTDTATPEVHSVSLHDALPICMVNSVGEMIPASSPTFSTTSSMSPRVFTSTPSDAASRQGRPVARADSAAPLNLPAIATPRRSEEHTSELQSRENLVCRLLLEK